MLTETGKVRCIECRRFNLQVHTGMAVEGYGQCVLDKDLRPGRFQSAVFPRLCGDFSPALKTVIERRVEWLRGQKPSARAYLTPEPVKGEAQ